MKRKATEGLTARDRPPRPTPEQVRAAHGTVLPDLIGPGLRVLFCGINPSLYSAAMGHHFARPGNRFWPTIHAAGFSGRLLSPWEERELLAAGYGITNVAARATAAAEELAPQEYVEGGRRLRAKLRHYRPAVLAVLGVGAYRAAFAQPRAAIGFQPETIEGCGLWVLPNPSGLNAHYQLRDLGNVYRQLFLAVHRRAR